MERIVIHGSDKTPEVLFDGNHGILSISGRSIPEGPKKLYDEIIEGIDEYAKDPQNLLTVTIDFEFFNTATARELLRIFRKLNEYNFGVKIIWVFEEGDDDMEEAGLDYEEMIKGLKFEFIEKSEES